MKILRWIVLSCLLILAQSAVVNAQSMDKITEELEALGIDVKGMGVPLTNYLKSGDHVLTY